MLGCKVWFTTGRSAISGVYSKNCIVAIFCQSQYGDSPNKFNVINQLLSWYSKSPFW